MSLVVAICGTGNMGSAIGAHLIRRGVRVVTALDGRTARSARLAADAGIVDLGGIPAMVAEADIVLSIMGSASAPPFASNVAAAAAGKPGLLFVDCNPVLPSAVVTMAAELERSGLRVVDAGISGSPPAGDRQPRIYASGPHAIHFAALGDYGLDITVVGHEIGQASALKILTAATWQGAVALAGEVYMAAEHYGLTERLVDDVRSLQPAFYDWLRQAIPEMPPKAARWSADMQVTRQTLIEGGGGGDFHDAASHFYRRIGRLEDSWHGITDIAEVTSRLVKHVEGKAE